MAPINLPDGTEVSEIVLPDGSTASKVLAPDGSTVFSAIPDSVITRIDGTSITTSTTPNQVGDVVDGNSFDINAGSIGSLGGRSDMLITDDNTSTTPFELPSSRAGSNINLNGGDWSIIAVVYYDGAVGERDGNGGSNSDFNALTQVIDSGFNPGLWVDASQSNNPVIWFDGGNIAEANGITANTFHLASVTYDATNNNLTVYRDDPTNNGTKTQSNYSGTGENWANSKITIGSRNDGDKTVNGGLPVVEYHDELLSDQDISDAYSKLI